MSTKTDSTAAETASDADGQPTVVTEWTPHLGQRAIMRHRARFKIVACGRRWGKSEMAAHVAFRHALENPGATIWWVAPTYDQANEYGFDNITPLLSPRFVAKDPKRTKPRKIYFENGSRIDFRAGSREDSLRGGGVDLLVIDEAGSVPERAWTEELRPTLSDTEGDMVAIGTPKGRNWFWRWHRRGQSTDAEYAGIASWSAPTYQNPHVADSEVDDASNEIPEHIFRQEYLAEFLDDESAVFQGLSDAIGDHATPLEPAEIPIGPDEGYAIGVDFARQQNYTAVVTLAPDGRVTNVERVQNTSWTRIQGLIEAEASTYAPATVAVDASRDNKIVEDLADVVDVRPVSFNASSKKTLIENTITALENGSVTLPTEGADESADQLLDEMRDYEFSTTKRGNVHYSAPEHAHDDCVDALALAVDARRVSGRRFHSRSDLADNTSESGRSAFKTRGSGIVVQR